MQRTAMLMALCLTVASAPAAAQQTRVASIEEQQAMKAGNTRPNLPTRAEHFFMRFIDQPARAGWFVSSGGLPPGGGFSLGPGYRWWVGDRSSFDVTAVASIKSYWRVEGAYRTRGLLQDHLDLELRAGTRVGPSIFYWGLGNDSSRDAKSSFYGRQTGADILGHLRTVPFLYLGGNVGVEDWTTSPGKGGVRPVDDVFDALTAPALGADPRYLRAGGYAAFDTRPSPSYSTSGTLLRVDYNSYRDTRDLPVDFDRIDLEVIQFLPILNANWVLAFHGLASTTTTPGDDVVPYFMMPHLGSGSTLRSFSSFRFRDRNRLLLTGEFRWRPNDFLDMALFYDAGKVAPSRRGLDLDGLQRSYGIGARFHSKWANVLRIELANGEEGLNLVFSTSQPF